MANANSHPTTPISDEVMARLVDTIAIAIAGKVAEHVTAAQSRSRQQAPASPGRSGYMTVGEAAEYLRCKPQRIYNLLSDRQIDRYKDGGRVLIRRDELESWIGAAQQAQDGVRRNDPLAHRR